MKFSFLDLVFLGGLVVAAYLGYRSGAMRKGIMLLGMIGGVLLAAKLTQSVAPFLVKIGFARTAAEITGFILLFVLFMVALLFLYRRFGKTGAGHATGRMIGTLFGLIQGVLILSVILIGMNVAGLPDKETRKASMLYEPIAQVLPRAFALLQAYLPGAGEVKEGLRDVL